MMGNGAVSQSTQTRSVAATAVPTAVRNSITGVFPNSFMPTSVMRQMTKNNNAPATAEEKLRHSNIPICSTQYSVVKQNPIPEHLSVPHKR